MNRRRALVILALGAMLLSACNIDLVGPDGPTSAGYGINDQGQVVGAYLAAPGQWGAFVTDSHTGAFTPIAGLPNSRSTQAQAINNAGQVVGDSDVQGDVSVFAWDEASGTRRIDVLGLHHEVPSDINELGQIVGMGWSSSTYKAWIWDEIAGGRELPGLGPAPCTYCRAGAGAINDAGLVAGGAETYSAVQQRSITHAVVWDTTTGSMVDLGALTAPDLWSSAEVISEAGVVVGSLEVSHDVYHAVQWTKTGTGWTMLDLTERSGGVVDHVTGINEKGQLAATDNGSPGDPQPPTAYRYTPATNEIVALGDLGFGGASTTDINEAGNLSGTASRPPSSGHGVRFQPLNG